MQRQRKRIRKKVIVSPSKTRNIVKKKGEVIPAKPKQKYKSKSVTIKSENKKKFSWKNINFYDVQPLFKGETVFLIGGGPSLKDFDFNQLKNKNTIAINKAFYNAPFADVLYWTDARFYSWYKKDIDQFKGLKFTIKPYGDLAKDIKVLKNTGKGGLEKDKNGLRHGNNSGYAAINLAYHLGAKRIILLGFDMGNVNSESHFHDGYPIKATPDKVYQKNMIPYFGSIGEELKKEKIEILNANTFSNLNAFKKISREQALSLY